MTFDHDDDQDQVRAGQLRQAADLDHINRYYRLSERLGVRVAIGDRIRFEGTEGRIADTCGHYLLVLLDGQEHPAKAHPTASMAYLTPGGWVEATPLPDLTFAC